MKIGCILGLLDGHSNVRLEHIGSNQPPQCKVRDILQSREFEGLHGCLGSGNGAGVGAKLYDSAQRHAGVDFIATHLHAT
ncbi:hypothetical protein HRbin30_02100 [bacterium HR30]|nr:hypothetical protein HRbin30_02100 [bacterium HR30]